MKTLITFFILLTVNTYATEPRKVLVAGGAGFIGSHLCQELVNQGYDVYCLDNFYTGSKRNVAPLLNKSSFHLINHDVIYPITLDVRFDKVFNLACPASPVHYQNRPIFTIKTSVIGTFNLLDIARRDNATFFQASTSEVYGDPKEHPQREEYFGNVNPIGPRACYDEGKRVAETICFEYMRQYGVKIKVGRIFNTYGPNMSVEDGRVVSNFISQAIKEDPITIYGDGSQTRSFCYVDDLVNAIIAFSDTKDDITGPINLGNPNEFTIGELAKHVCAMINSETKVEYFNLPQDDPRLRKPNIDKAKTILGWTPRVQLKDGLNKTLPYFQSELKKS